MSQAFDYLLSGLCLRSEIPLPELVPAPETAKPAEVRVRLAETPKALEKPVDSGVLYEAAPGQFLLHMPGIAHYFARNGEEIIVEPETGSLAAEVRLFLLGTVWAALMHQRELLVLHASGIRTSLGAVIFIGRSSVGKSSLAAAFYRQGYPVLGDDVMVVKVNDERALAYPGFPQLHVWPDMLYALEVPPAEVTLLRPKLAKRVLATPIGFTSEPQPVKAIYVLQFTNNEEELKLEHFQGMTRFSVLLNNTFREKFLGGLGVRPAHFHQVNGVARSVPVASLTRPEQPPQLERMVEMIKEDLGL